MEYLLLIPFYKYLLGDGERDTAGKLGLILNRYTYISKYESLTFTGNNYSFHSTYFSLGDEIRIYSEHLYLLLARPLYLRTEGKSLSITSYQIRMEQVSSRK
jgi:hypothetical protein